MIPTSSKLLLMVMVGLEANDGPPTFERIQKAVLYGVDNMPLLEQTGLTGNTHDLQQLIKQTIELGYIHRYESQYMLTQSGKNVIRGVHNDSA